MFLRSKIIYKLSSCLIGIILIIIIYKNINENEKPNDDKGYYDKFVSVQQVVEGDIPTQIDKKKMLNITHFQYVLPNPICKKYYRDLLGVIIVTSYAGHDELRSAHRQAISQMRLNDMGFLRVFLLARIPPNEKFVTESQIIDEQNKFGDLIQGNFFEAYRNLTYKHIMGLKWIVNECRNTKFIVKVDDDIVFDIFHIKKYLESIEIKGHQKTTFMAGFILDNKIPIRNSMNKWFVSLNEFQENTYPDYLSGWLYITNTQTAIELIEETERSPLFFWIDDILVTGILRSKRNISLIKLNSWFSSNSEFIDCCVRDLKVSSLECEYFVGPNGGDSKLIVEFLHGIEKCYFGRCIKRLPGKTVKTTCVAVRKNLVQNHGESLVRSVRLK